MNKKSKTGFIAGLIAEVVGLLMQLYLLFLSASVIFSEERDYGYALLYWSMIAFVYLGATALYLSLLLRFTSVDPLSMNTIIKHPVTHAISVTITFGASFMGLLVATDFLSELSSKDADRLTEFAAILTMFLSWALFNWGYARVYFARYYREDPRPLEFPGTTVPRLSDFAYLAFTNATTFASPDVQVLNSRMRWTIVWHTTIAFFFNALIIGLVINVIINGNLLSGLLSD